MRDGAKTASFPHLLALKMPKTTTANTAVPVSLPPLPPRDDVEAWETEGKVFGEGDAFYILSISRTNLSSLSLGPFSY
jgi:hypothetical protein